MAHHLPADQMEMEMEDRLPRIRPIIRDEAVSLFDPFFFGDLLRDLDDFSKQVKVLRLEAL